MIGICIGLSLDHLIFQFLHCSVQWTFKVLLLLLICSLAKHCSSIGQNIVRPKDLKWSKLKCIIQNLSTRPYMFRCPCVCPMRFGSQEAYQEGESLIIPSILHLLLFPLSPVSRPFLSVCQSQGLINFETFTNFLQLKPGLSTGGYPDYQSQQLFFSILIFARFKKDHLG